MKKLKFLEIYILAFFIEIGLLGAVIEVLKYYRIVLTIEPPFYSNFHSVASSALTDYQIIKHNLQAMACWLFLSSLVGLVYVAIVKGRILNSRLMWYLGSAIVGSTVAFYGLHLWLKDLWLVLVGLAIGYVPAAFSHERYLKDNPEKEKIIRGSLKIEDQKVVSEFQKLAKKEMVDQKIPGIKIWKGLALPFKRENEHLLIIGSTGSGKTQIIYPLVDQIINRGDKIIIWDVKGTYTQAFGGNKNVLLLAPWDKRSVKWCIGKDVRNSAECLSIAHIILPENIKDPQPYFLNSARQVLESSMLHFLASDKVWGWGDLWDFLIQGRKKLSDHLRHTAEGRAARIAIDASNRSSQDVYSTMITACKSIKWLAKAWPGEGISLREWIKEGKENVLILGGVPERADLAAMSANLATNILLNEILSLPDDLNRRIWLVLDEFGSLPKNDQIINAFTVGRSKGLCSILGIQDIGRIQYSYGRELSKTIINSFNTSIFLRCTDPETNRWISQYLGEQELREHQSTTESVSKSQEKNNKHESKTETLQRKALYLPSEISDLEAMTGVLKVSGWPSGTLKWPLKVIPNNSPVVENADWVNEKPVFDEEAIEDDVDIPNTDLNDLDDNKKGPNFFQD